MRTLLALSALSLSLGIACSGAPAPTAKTFDDVKVSCCGDANTDKVLAEYLDVQSRLAAGETPSGDVTALFAASKKISAPGLTSAVGAIKDQDLATMRAGFSAVSNEVKKLVNAGKGSGGHTVAWVSCDKEGAGGWYQSSSAISNPYGVAGCGQF